MSAAEGSAPTPGPWQANMGTGKAGANVTSPNGTVCFARQRVGGYYAKPCLRPEMEANARLIAEAGTVLHETGKTPRQLADEVAGLRAARLAYASEFPPDSDGEPDVGSIHANIRELKAKHAELADEVERLRAQRDALLAAAKFLLPRIRETNGADCVDRMEAAVALADQQQTAGGAS